MEACSGLPIIRPGSCACPLSRRVTRLLSRLNALLAILLMLRLSKRVRGGVNMPEAYCMKCRTKREMKDPKPITMKNGKPATEGTCPECGTKLFRIGKAE